MNVLEKIRELGYDTPPETLYDSIGLWQQWYEGTVKSFHNYRVFNGIKKINCTRYSLGMGKKVSEDWANLLMNEKVKITLEGEKEQQFIDEVFKENKFTVKANELQEKKAALGTAAYVPRASSVAVNPESGNVLKAGSIKIDYITAENIVPLTWENGVVSECAFLTSKTIGEDVYVLIQIHKLNESGTYDIENHVCIQQNGNLKEVGLGDVDAFKNILPVIHTNSSERQFVIDRLNIADNRDITSPMGISVFANAIDQLRGVDIAYDSYVNEFVLGKKRIMVKPSAIKNLDGEPFFDTNDVAYYLLPEDSQDESTIVEINMDLRVEAHNTGIQDMLNVLSSKCGFGENHYQFDRGNVSTATQIISENSTLFRNIKKHEIILHDVLEELCRILLRLGNSYMNLGLDEDVELSIDFDDSIIEDKETDFNRDMQLLSAGIISPVEFRMKWLNEDEETAKKALPQMEQLVKDETGADEA